MNLQNNTKTAEIVNELLNVNDPQSMKNDLRELMDTYFLNEGAISKNKGSVYGTFTALDRALISVGELLPAV